MMLSTRLPAALGISPALTGCPWHDVNEMLQSAGLRPTRQRMALGWLLFGKGARHLTAEMLYEEAHAGQGSGVAGDRLQHAQPADRCRPAAPGHRSTAPRPISTPT